MAKEQCPRPTECFNVGIIGHAGYGKTTLTAAAAKVMTGKYYAETDQVREESMAGITMSAECVEYRSNNRRYAHIDYPGRANYIKNMIAGPRLDAAILVVSVADGPLRQTSEHILFAKQVDVSLIVVYLNKVDQVDQPELIELTEIEIRELLNKYDFPAESTPIIAGSALKALAGDASEMGVASVLKLVRAMDDYLSLPKLPVERPLLLPVAEVRAVAEDITVVTGRVERGQIKSGDEVEIVGIKDTITAVCVGVETLRKQLDGAQADGSVEVSLRGVRREDIHRGQVLAQKGSVNSGTCFQAAIYVLSKEEGGRHTPFFNGYRPQFHFRTASVAGAVVLPADNDMVMPGDHVLVEVTLLFPIALEKGLRFTMGEQDHKVGVGVVTKVIE